MNWKEILKPTPLKTFVFIIYFLLSPIRWEIIFPIPLVFIFGGLDNLSFWITDLSYIFSTGVLINLLLALPLAYIFAGWVSNRYYKDNSESKIKKVFYFLLKAILALIIYLIVYIAIGVIINII